jgi:hypothetical protein
MHKEKAPPIAEPSQCLIPLDLSLGGGSGGAHAVRNAYDACGRLGGGNV